MLKKLIKKFKDKKIENRLFKNKLQKDKFILAGIESLRSVYLRQVYALKEYYILESNDEIKSRKNDLKNQGLIPPNNVNECDRFINDMRNYKYDS